MAQQVTGNLVTEITAVSAMNGRLIFLHLKNPKAKQEHKVFLPVDLCGKLLPLLIQTMDLAQSEQQKARLEQGSPAPSNGRPQKAPGSPAKSNGTRSASGTGRGRKKGGQ